MVERLEQWPRLLSAYLVERKTAEFRWGKNDCLMFVAGAILAITGRDVALIFPSYHDEKGANAILKSNGGIMGMITKAVGNEGDSNVRMATRGDIVVANLPHLSAGIVDDSGRFFCSVNELGLTKHPLSVATRYWSY